MCIYVLMFLEYCFTYTVKREIFEGANGMAREPSEEIFMVVIFAVQCQETTPTTNFVREIPVRGSFSQF